MADSNICEIRAGPSNTALYMIVGIMIYSNVNSSTFHIPIIASGQDVEIANMVENKYFFLGFKYILSASFDTHRKVIRFSFGTERKLSKFLF